MAIVDALVLTSPLWVGLLAELFDRRNKWSGTRTATSRWSSCARSRS